LLLRADLNRVVMRKLGHVESRKYKYLSRDVSHLSLIWVNRVCFTSQRPERVDTET
jgi:hypothetical protein